MTDGLIVGLVVLAVLIGFAIYGGVKGFAGVILGLASWVIALLLTWRLYPIVANWFVNWGMRDALAVFFEDKLKLFMQESDRKMSGNRLFEQQRKSRSRRK